MGQLVDKMDVALTDLVVKKVSASIKKIVQVDKPLMKNLLKLITDILKKAAVDKSMSEQINRIN